MTKETPGHQPFFGNCLSYNYWLLSFNYCPKEIRNWQSSQFPAPVLPLRSTTKQNTPDFAPFVLHKGTLVFFVISLRRRKWSYSITPRSLWVLFASLRRLFLWGVCTQQSALSKVHHDPHRIFTYTLVNFIKVGPPFHEMANRCFVNFVNSHTIAQIYCGVHHCMHVK